jgi:hypothetical protein
MDEVAEMFDADLGAGAYSKVGGTPVELTDIKPAYLWETLNKVFGVLGVGWFYEITSSGYDSDSKTAFVDIMFRYGLVENGKKYQSAPIPALGANKNSGHPEWALAGALTYALGNAVSRMGFQSSVYKGERSHTDYEKPKAGRTRQAPKPNTPTETNRVASETPPSGPSRAGKVTPGAQSALKSAFSAKLHELGVTEADGLKAVEEMYPGVPFDALTRDHLAVIINRFVAAKGVM